MGPNLFSIRFGSAKDRELVLRGGPWFFSRQLIALNVFDITLNPASIPISRVPFWIQVHGLPYTHRTEKMARALGDSFGGFIDWDRYEANRYGVCLRIRAWLNIEAPLRRGQMITQRGKPPMKVAFKYEKLITFCYRCGKLDHGIKDCEAPGDGVVNKFGNWMRTEGEEDKRHGGRREEGPYDGEFDQIE